MKHQNRELAGLNCSCAYRKNDFDSELRNDSHLRLETAFLYMESRRGSVKSENFYRCTAHESDAAMRRTAFSLDYLPAAADRAMPAADKAFKLLSGAQSSSFSAVYVAVQGEREASMTCDILKSLGIRSRLVRYGQTTKTKCVSGGVMNVNALVDHMEHVAVSHLADALLAAPIDAILLL